MSTVYPGGIDSYTNKVDGVSTVAAADTNNLQDAVRAIETELGTNPSGTYETVAQAITDQLSRAGGTMTGDINMGSNSITNLADPVNFTDAVNLQFAESLVDLLSRLLWQDDFCGIKAPNWTLAATGGTYTQNSEVGGTGTLATGGTTSNDAFLRFNGKGCTDKTKDPEVITRARINSTTQLRVVLAGLYFDADNLIEIYYDVTSTAGNFMYRCRSGGTETTADSNLAADTDYHEFELSVDNAAGEVEFQIDGGNSATITTNIPSAVLEPNIGVATKENADKTLTVDFYQLYAQR